jgi:hypothetical protein
MISAVIKEIKTALEAKNPYLYKLNDLCDSKVYPIKQADGSSTPCVLIQLTGCNPINTKEGYSTAETNDIEITCIADHPRTAFQMAALCRMGFDIQQSNVIDDDEGVDIQQMIFVNWASDVFEPTDLFTITLRFEAYTTLRQDLTNYL